MTSNCPYCGTPLLQTSFNRKYCPNCGIIEEAEESEEKEPKYIG